MFVAGRALLWVGSSIKRKISEQHTHQSRRYEWELKFIFSVLMADASPNSTVCISSTEKMDVSGADSLQEEAHALPPDEIERKARVDAMWQQMNKGVPAKNLKSILQKKRSTVNKSPKKKTTSNGWMGYLGMGSKKTASPTQGVPEKRTSIVQNISSEDVKKLAAAALAAVQDAAVSAMSGTGKVEITEVRDFAGEQIEVKKLVDAESADKGRVAAGSTSAVDAVLEQIRKKPKLSVLDKTKKDWGEFKDDNKGVEDELDAYKKSSNQYLDRQSFLQRTDYREFERERDARLAQQAKRKTDMREDF